MLALLDSLAGKPPASTYNPRVFVLCVLQHTYTIILQLAHAGSRVRASQLGKSSVSYFHCLCFFNQAHRTSSQYQSTHISAHLMSTTNITLFPLDIFSLLVEFHFLQIDQKSMHCKHASSAKSKSCKCLFSLCFSSFFLFILANPPTGGRHGT